MLSLYLLQPPLPPPGFCSMLQGFFCPHWDVRSYFASRNKNPCLGLTETFSCSIMSCSRTSATSLHNLHEDSGIPDESQCYPGQFNREWRSGKGGWFIPKELQPAPFLASGNEPWLLQRLSTRGSKATTAQRCKSVAKQSIEPTVLAVDTQPSTACCKGNSQLRNGTGCSSQCIQIL